MKIQRLLFTCAAAALTALLTTASTDGPRAATPGVTIDLAEVPDSSARLRRVYGSVGDGSFGLPVSGGFDIDADGHPDYAVGAMLADPLARTDAGEVFLTFGDGSVGAPFDTATVQSAILRIAGSGTLEMAGSELWMDDVTGDGVGDLLIARQNLRGSSPDRPGAGALTILVGGSAVGTFAATQQVLDLASPPPSLTLFTIVGAATTDRLGIWMRTGDVTGDGTADLVVGADQESFGGETHRGAAYVIRGGAHLATNTTIDLKDFGTTALAGHIARVIPPPDPDMPPGHDHFGSTCQIADLDGNGDAEVLIASSLNRAGASIDADGAPANSADSFSINPGGTLYIVWDDNFPAGTWAAALTIDLDSPTGGLSVIEGDAVGGSKFFGEEILGGLDYDDDGDADLFVGDITGDLSGEGRAGAGAGHLFYDAAGLEDQSFALDAVPMGIELTTFLGGASGDLAADTGLHGDFDGDGIDDLAFSSPHAAPLGRISAGKLHIFYGRSGGWPSSIDLKHGELPEPSEVHIVEILGAQGTSGSDKGDTLSYSGQAGDINGDGRTDLITNEMVGNGLGGAPEDVGNLIILSGMLVSVPVPGWLPPVLAAGFVLTGWRRLDTRRRSARPV